MKEVVNLSNTDHEIRTKKTIRTRAVLSLTYIAAIIAIIEMLPDYMFHESNKFSGEGNE